MLAFKKFVLTAHAFMFNPTTAMITPPEPNSSEQTQAINSYTAHFFNTLSIPTITSQLRTTYRSLEGKKLSGLHSYPRRLTELFREQQLRQLGLANITYDDACRLIVGLSVLREQRIQQELFAAPLNDTTKEIVSSEAALHTINIINSILAKNNGLPESLKKRVNPARYFEYLYMNPDEQCTQEVFELIQRATVQKTIDHPSNCSSYSSIIAGEYATVDPSAAEQIDQLRTTYIEKQLESSSDDLYEADEHPFITDNDLQTLITELVEDLTEEPLSEEVTLKINTELKEYFTNRYHS